MSVPTSRPAIGHPVPPLYLNAAETACSLPMSELIRAVGHAFRDGARAPDRLIAPDDDSDWIIMPALSPSGFVCKIVNVAPNRRTRNLPTISGSVLAFNDIGELTVVADAGALTARRTAAIAGYATDLLANPDASVLALFGTGALAQPHVEAISTVRDVSEVRVVGRTPDKSETFARSLRHLGYPAISSSTKEAMADANIVVTVTTSKRPLFSDDMVEAGCHINAMGVYHPDRREIPGETVARARLAVEHRDTAWEEAGDLIIPEAEGLITRTSVIADFTQPEEMATVRRSNDDVTMFKSVGHALFDVAALTILQENA